MKMIIGLYFRFAYEITNFMVQSSHISWHASQSHILLFDTAMPLDFLLCDLLCFLYIYLIENSSPQK